MNFCKIITLHPIFNESAIVLSQRLKIEIVKEFEPTKGTLYIVYGAHEKAVELLNIQNNHQHSFGYIIMNSEQPSSKQLKIKYYIELMKNNIVFDYHTESSNYLKETFGIITKSYHWFDFIEYDIESEACIDILFVGSHSKEREEVYLQLQFQHPDKKIEFVFDNSLIQPLELTKKLKQAKVLLNIPYHHDKILESHRINKGLSCGCKVVSMKSGDAITDALYDDYIYFVDDICDIDFTILDKPKKKYIDLQKKLTNTLTAHNKWYIEQLLKKSSNIS